MASEHWHPTAIIDPEAEIEPDVKIGAYCTIGKGCRIGSGTVLHPQVQIIENTTLGRNCQVFCGVVLGGPPQDTKFRGEQSFVLIGDNNVLREYVTVHRATGEGSSTRLGHDNMVMAYSHIGHNCEIGNQVIIASYVGISGHVIVEDRANFGGLCGVHQEARIGTHCMIGGMTGITTDIPPYMLAQGSPAKVIDTNSRGLKKAGISDKTRRELRQAYKLLYRSSLNVTQALEAIEEEIESSPELDHLVNFIRTSREGFRGRGNSSRPA